MGLEEIGAIATVEFAEFLEFLGSCADFRALFAKAIRETHLSVFLGMDVVVIVGTKSMGC